MLPTLVRAIKAEHGAVPPMLRSTAAVTAVAPYHQMCQFRSKPMQNLDSTEELPTAADLRASSPQKNEASDAELPPTPEVLLQREQEQLPEKGGASSSWGSFSWVALVDAVKKQSEAVVDVYKRDLSEFVAVVTTESAQQFDKVAQTIITGAQFELPNSEQYQDSSVTIKGGPPPLSNPSTAQSHSSLAGHTQSKQSPLFSRTTGDPTVRQDEKLDVSPGMSAQAEQMFGMFKSGFTSLISSAVEVVESTVTEVRSSVAVQSQDGPSRDEHIFTRRTTDRESLQKDPTTYTIDPSESQDPKVLNRFQQFASSFEFSAKSSEVEELHASSAPIRLMHNTLVPGTVSEETFWLRYYFQLLELERNDEARRQIVRQVESKSQVDEEFFSWGSEDEDDDETSKSNGSQEMEDQQRQNKEKLDIAPSDPNLPLGDAPLLPSQLFLPAENSTKQVYLTDSSSNEASRPLSLSLSSDREQSLESHSEEFSTSDFPDADSRPNETAHNDKDPSPASGLGEDDSDWGNWE